MAHTCVKVAHRTVEREVPQKMAERVAAEGLEGRSEVEHKMFLHDDDLMEVDAEEEEED